jgi:hypothetical protein
MLRRLGANVQMRLAGGYAAAPNVSRIALLVSKYACR